MLAKNIFFCVYKNPPFQIKKHWANVKFFALGVTEENVSIWLTTGTLEAEVLNIYKYIC